MAPLEFLNSLVSSLLFPPTPAAQLLHIAPVLHPITKLLDTSPVSHSHGPAAIRARVRAHGRIHQWQMKRTDPLPNLARACSPGNWAFQSVIFYLEKQELLKTPCTCTWSSAKGRSFWRHGRRGTAYLCAQPMVRCCAGSLGRVLGAGAHGFVRLRGFWCPLQL